MNKKMRELLEKMQTKMDEVKNLSGEDAATKKSAMLTEIEEIRKEFEQEKTLYETEKAVAALAAGDKSDKSDPNVNPDEKDADVKAFAGYVRSVVSKTSTPQNITMGSNGAIMPKTIAQKIVLAVKELCPIVSGCTEFHVKGTLSIPVYGDATDDDSNAHNVSVAFSDEFSELTADAGKFSSVDLTGYLAGALVLIGRSVINNADIDLVNFVVAEMGRRIALFLSDKYLNGASNKNTGALSTTNNLNAGSTTDITVDNLIDLQMKIPTIFQKNACWTMSSDTLGVIRKLKYSDGRYILQTDLTKDFPYVLLGKPVHLDDNMPAIASAAKPILYGDYHGLASNFREDINIQVLNELFASKHAIGIVAWFEFDTKMMDNQQLATLTMSA